MNDQPQKPKLSRKERKQQQEILSNWDEMNNISPEEFERRIRVGIEKERKKLKWKNLDAGTKLSGILTMLLIITAFGALFFQWTANNATRDNLEIVQKQFKLAYRPYVSINNASFKIVKDSINLIFDIENSGDIPAIIDIKCLYNANGEFKEIKYDHGLYVIFPGHSDGHVQFYPDYKKNFEIILDLHYKDHSSQEFKYNTFYHFLIGYEDKSIHQLDVSAY